MNKLQNEDKQKVNFDSIPKPLLFAGLQDESVSAPLDVIISNKYVKIFMAFLKYLHRRRIKLICPKAETLGNFASRPLLPYM